MGYKAYGRSRRWAAPKHQLQKCEEGEGGKKVVVHFFPVFFWKKKNREKKKKNRHTSPPRLPPSNSIQFNSMDFSDALKTTTAVVVSNDGSLIGCAVDFRVVVRDTKTLDIVNLFTCVDKVSSVALSGDSSRAETGQWGGFVLAVVPARACVQVWGVGDDKWSCRIDEGVAGIVRAVWAPDSRQIVTFAEHALRITVWSLIDQTASYIQLPKFSSKAAEFSPDGQWFAVCERKDGKDMVSLFSVGEQWALAKHFQTDTNDLADLAFSPDSACLVCWDNPVEYRAVIHALDGRRLRSFSAYEGRLGIKSVAWSPSSQLLALASFDEAIRILNHLTWKVVVEFKHAERITSRMPVVYVESPGQGRFDLAEPPVSLPFAKPDMDKPNPALGVGWCEFSRGNRYLATRSDGQPQCVWIWDLARASLSTVLVLSSPVRKAAWDPLHERIALVSGGLAVYLWSPDGASVVAIPGQDDFAAVSLQWAPDGEALIIRDKNQRFSVAFPGTTQGEQEE
jgi:WD40 repeat protein